MDKNRQILTRRRGRLELLAIFFKWVEQFQELATSSGCQKFKNDLLNTLYVVILNTCAFFDDCEKWDKE